MDTEIGCFMKPEVAMQRRRFSREFKLEAVKLVRERGLSAAQAARDLDAHENVLCKWGKEFGSAPRARPRRGVPKNAIANASIPLDVPDRDFRPSSSQLDLYMERRGLLYASAVINVFS